MASRNQLNPLVGGVPSWIANLLAPDDTEQQSSDQSDPSQFNPQDYINSAMQSLGSLSQMEASDDLASQQAQRQPQALPVDSSGPATGGASSGTSESGLGLSPQQQAAFDWVIGKESGGNPNAKNPKSTAFGEGQLLDYNRASYAKKLGISNPNTTNPAEQQKMALQYMNDRYGGPQQAQNFWKRHGWY